MKKLFIAAFMFVSIFGTKVMADIKMGIILGFTGPIESLTPAMAASAELAFKEASAKASLAESLIAGVRDSIGPVNPKIIPILISANELVVKVETSINAAINSFFIIFLIYC